MPNLPRRQIKRPLPRLRVPQLQFRVYVGRPQLAHQPLRAAHPNLRLRYRHRTDLQLRWYVLKLNRHSQRHLRRFLVWRNRHPQSDRNYQRQNLEPEIMQHPASQKSGHNGRSDSPSSASALICTRARIDDPSSASESSSGTTVGNATGAIYRRSSPLSRSRNCSAVKSRSIFPPTATLIAPDSSDTITAIASVSSVIPIPARCRVPICVDSTGFIDSGRKRAAAANRSFWIITAPSCNGALGRKIVASRS